MVDKRKWEVMVSGPIARDQALREFHGSHDQKTHGNWASASGPAKWRRDGQARLATWVTYEGSQTDWGRRLGRGEGTAEDVEAGVRDMLEQDRAEGAKAGVEADAIREPFTEAEVQAAGSVEERVELLLANLLEWQKHTDLVRGTYHNSYAAAMEAQTAIIAGEAKDWGLDAAMRVYEGEFYDDGSNPSSGNFKEYYSDKRKEV